jgi:hypothetical protein
MAKAGGLWRSFVPLDARRFKAGIKKAWSRSLTPTHALRVLREEAFHAWQQPSRHER